MELSSLVFSATTTELERASTVIAALVQDMSQISVASANMARISAQTEAILARAATESAKARKENARAADIEIKTVIAADKADAARAESIRKAAEAERRRTEATEESTRATRSNVDILQRQTDIYEFLAAGFSKGQASILATAKAAGQLSDELKGVLEAQKQFTSDSFDQSETGLKRLLKTTKEVTDAQRYFNEGANLTTKQARELSNDLDRLNASLAAQGKSYQEVNRAQAIYKQQFLDEAAVVNRANAALDAITKQRREVVSATDYMTTAEQKMTAALNTSNAAIDRSGTDLLVKYEAALRKSGVAQDVATQKLATYKTQLAQVQAQEEQRRADHLTRSLPAQATDIAVSLWSGQNPLTVLLQQGGQINDMFMQSGVAAEDFSKVVRASLASMVPAMMTVATGIAEVLGGMFVDAGKSVLDFISDVSGISAAVEQAQRWIVAAGEANFRWIGVMQRFGETATKVMAVGLLALVTTMVAVAMKYKEIIQSENELSKALALNGGAMDMTKESAIDYADSMKQVGIGNLKAQESMTAFINAGAMGAETMDAAREAAVALEKYAGIALSDTAKEFAKLQDEPSKALIEIAKNTGQVEKATLDVISALEKEQGASAAAAAATVYAADAKKKAADEIKASLSPIETLWRDIKSAIGQVGQAVYDLATSNEVVNGMRRVWQTVAVIISETWFVIKGVGKEIGGIAAQVASIIDTKSFSGAAAISVSMKENAQAARAEHDKLIASIMTKGDVEKKQFTSNKAQNSEYAEWLEKNSKALAKSQSKEEQFAIKKKQLQADLKKELIDEVKYNEALAGWKRVIMGEDKKPKAAPKDTFYETSMAKFRDAAIAATDASKELTKSQIELMQTTSDPEFLALSKQKQNDILQSGAAAIAKEKEKEATIALGKAEDFREKVLGKSQGLGKQYYADIEALHKHAEAAKWSTEQIDEQIQMIFKGTPVYQNYQKTIDRMTEALRKFSEESITYRASTNSENQELNHRISLLGKTAEEQRKIQIEYQREIKLNETKYDLEKKLRDIAKERKEAEGKGVVDLQKFADAEVQARQDAADRTKVINKGVAVEYASDLDKEIAAVKRGISDSIVTALFDGGKEGSKQLRNVLVDTLRKKVTIVVDAVVNTLVGNVLGAITGGAAGAAGQAGGSMLGSTGGSLLGAAAGGVGAFGIGASYGATSLLANGLGATLSAGSSMIGAGSIMSGLGTIAGALGPIAIGIAAIASLVSSLDDSGTYHSGAGAVYSASGGVKEGAGIYNQSIFGMGATTEYSKESQVFATGVAKGLSQTFDALAVAFGEKAGYEVAAAFADDVSKDGAWGSLRISKEGKDLLNWKDTQTSKWAPREFADGEAGQKEYLVAIAKDTRQVLLDMDLPSWADNLLNSIGDAPTMEQLATAVGQIGQIQTVFVQLGQTVAGFAGMSDKVFESLLRASGGVEMFTQNINTFYQEFYTESERLENSTKLLSAEFTKAGVEMPKTREEFKALVLAQFAAGESGAELAGKLLKLSPAFAEIVPAAAQASKQITTVNKLLSNLGILTKIEDVDFTEVTKSLFESLGLSVEEYSNSIASAITGIVTGKIKAEDAGKALADAAVGGITDAIAQGASQAIAAQFVSSIISPVIANIMAGKAALDGIDMQAGLTNLKNGTDALKAVLNTVGSELADALGGLGAVVSGAASGVTSAVGTNQYGGVGDSPFAIGGSAVNTSHRSPEAQSLAELTNQTIESNKKVSELLQKLLNPEKLFDNRYKELDSRLEEQRKALSRTNVGGGLGVVESTLQADIDKLTSTIADTSAVNAIIDPMMVVLERMATSYGFSNDAATADSIFTDLTDLILSRNSTAINKESGLLLGSVMSGNSTWSIEDRVKATLQDVFSSASSEGKSDWFDDYINNILGITSEPWKLDADLKAKTEQLAVLEKELSEWYLAQARVIAVEDMTELSKESTAAKAKTAELKRTEGLEDPIAKLKESMSSKILAIDEGIGAVLLKEVQKATDPAKKQELLDEIAKYKASVTEWYRAQADLLSTEMLVDINNQIKELQKSEEGPITAIKSVIAKYIKDLTELGTLDATAQAAIDKLSGLQLTKARKSLYDQLLTSEEIKTRDTSKLKTDFVGLGKVIPETTQGLRAMIDAANAAGNTTLADKLLELVPAFLAVQDAVDGTSDALSKAKTATDEAYAALERAVEAQRTILTESITKLKAVFDAAKNATKTLYSEVDGVRKQSAAAGNAFINQALQDLKNSGVIPDGVKLQDAIDDAMQGLSSEVYDSAFEEQKGRLILAGKLTTIADLTEPQLTLAEKQLKDLDAILETARAQIDELRGINTSVLSVATAVSNLAAAIAAEKATAVKPPTSTPITGGVFPQPWKDTGSGGGGTTVVPPSTGNASVIEQAYQIVLGRDPEAAGAAFWGSVLGSGATLTEAINAIVGGAQASGEAIKLPGFDVGINNVPYDMPAYLHAGESVIPSEFNPFNPNAVSPLSLVPASSNAPVQQDNSEIIEENRLLRQELQAQNGAMVRLLSKVARVVERWDGDGMPEARTTTA